MKEEIPINKGYENKNWISMQIFFKKMQLYEKKIKIKCRIAITWNIKTDTSKIEIGITCTKSKEWCI